MTDFKLELTNSIPLPGSVTQTGLAPVYLCAWQRRLIDRVGELLDGRKSAMLLVRIDGPAMTFWRILPDGRVELE